MGSTQLEEVFCLWGSHPEDRKRTRPRLPLVARDAITAFLGFGNLVKLFAANTKSKKPTEVVPGREKDVAKDLMRTEDTIVSCESPCPAPNQLSTSSSPPSSSSAGADAHVKDEKPSEEMLELYNAELSKAILQSRIDATPLSADNIVILRLTKHSPIVVEAFTNSPELEVCRTRLHEAGCEMSPAWANGAKLLVPLTEDQVDEARFEDRPIVLRSHHVVVLQAEVNLVRTALSKVPKRCRPNLRTDSNAVNAEALGGDHASGALDEPTLGPMSTAQDDAGYSEPYIDVEVVGTFVTCPIPKDVSELSEVVESAPCGHGDSPQPPNPRKWQRPSQPHELDTYSKQPVASRYVEF